MTEFARNLPRLNEKVANSARMYDYFLGGCHNFAVDRKTADLLERVYPGARITAYANRGFLRRVVRYLVSQGVDQFLDLGSGVPTAGNVHEIAQAAHPDARVVYVDVEPVAVKAAQRLLADNPNATTFRADLRDTRAILNHPEVESLLDLSRPVGVLMMSVLHFVPDSDDPAGVINDYRDAVLPGSFLALSHSTDAPMRAEDVEQSDLDGILDVFTSGGSPATLRPPAEVERFFAGWELVEPGVVPVFDWRPEDPDEFVGSRDRIPFWGGVGRKP
ncbi:MAG TPA: SAM-dependent methyltransferase [Pseudonocardiaceae bacterium]|nr:SAM-dependent methyltransferase [Pseudonocardiaceae bacterium]